MRCRRFAGLIRVLVLSAISVQGARVLVRLIRLRSELALQGLRLVTGMVVSGHRRQSLCVAVRWGSESGCGMERLRVDFSGTLPR